MQANLEEAYTQADDLYQFMVDNFSSFKEWQEFETTNGELIDEWEEHRLWRIKEQAKAGLVGAASKGNAAAWQAVRHLLSIPTNPVGRPKGTALERDPDYQAALEARLLDDYNKDVNRLNN